MSAFLSTATALPVETALPPVTAPTTAPATPPKSKPAAVKRAKGTDAPTAAMAAAVDQAPLIIDDGSDLECVAHYGDDAAFFRRALTADEEAVLRACVEFAEAQPVADPHGARGKATEPEHDATAFARTGVTVMYGKTHPRKRLTAFVSDDAHEYRYGGSSDPAVRTSAAPPYKALLDLTARLFPAADGGPAPFNSCLLNRYEADDALGAHSDKEAELAPGHGVVTFEIGGVRPLEFTDLATGERTRVPSLRAGVSVMHGAAFQKKTKHAVLLPGKDGDKSVRYSFTMRVFKTGAKPRTAKK